MAFFSLQAISTGLISTIKRFPLEVLVVVIGSISACLIIADVSFSQSDDILSRFLITSVFTLPLILSVSLYTENIKSKLLKFFLLTAAVIISIVFFFLLPEKYVHRNVLTIILLIFSTHLSVSFAPFLKNSSEEQFWNYNKELFLRLLLSGLYSFVLFAGLALALLAIDNLFNVEIEEELYGYLFVIIAGVFNSLFFLSGIPRSASKQYYVYPKGLKIFTQFVLLPLVSIYIIILYMYAGKILVNWEWPTGWVSYLVISLSVVGVFSLLLVYPIRFSIEYRWIRIYSSIFYWALFPLAIMLFAAISRRINEYGVTENRYYVILIAIWLLMIAIFQMITKQRKIRIIPISLFVIVLLSLLGPWSAFSISKNAQLQRLDQLLENNKLIQNGYVIGEFKEIDFKDCADISSINQYLVEMHGRDVLQKYFKEPVDSLIFDTVYTQDYVQLTEKMGIDFVYAWDYEENQQDNFSYYSTSNSPDIHNVHGIDYLIHYSDYFYLKEKKLYNRNYQCDSLDINISFDGNSGDVKVNILNDTMLLNIEEWVNELWSKNAPGALPDNRSLAIMEDSVCKVSVKLESINGSIVDNRPEINSVIADFYIELK
ncbi:MAG: hypothetical protein C0594_07035 [Marinilabiliales bacterium]|nr:MAG: hypothetical protein C0594_07035 [Marinilabiliales bacterium]